MKHTPTPQLLSPNKIAELLSVSTRTVQRLMAQGEFPVVKVGRATRIPLDAVEKYIAANTY